MSIPIFIGNLNYETTERELLDLLETAGTIISLKIVTDKFTLKSKGFAHCKVPDKETAIKIINNLNGTNLKSRNIKIEFFNHN